MARTFLSALVIATTLLSCQSTEAETDMPQDADNPQPSAQNQEWKPLLNTQTTSGWHSYGKSAAGEAWKVTDGTLYLDPSAGEGTGGDLVTDEEYEDFHLKLDWKVAKNGNSGIIFYVKEDPAKYPNTYNTGLEMQVLDNDGHPDAKINKHRAGDLYDLVASSSETVKPAGEWNQVEIISQDGRLRFIQNGTAVVDTTLWDDNWKAMIAGSKFADMPDFGTFKSGKIALQDHGDAVWYRNIMIKSL